MKKAGIYLAVRSQITICAIKALLSSLPFSRELEFLGRGADPGQCLEDIRRMKPELVLIDQEVCKNQECSLCRKLAEDLPDIRLICIQSSLCRQELEAGSMVKIPRSELSRERLIEILRHCLHDRSKKEHKKESCFVLMAAVKRDRRTETELPAADGENRFLSQARQLLNEQGGSLKSLGTHQNMVLYLAEGKQKRMLQQTLQNLMERVNSPKTGICLSISAVFSETEDILLFQSLFEEAAERQFFYGCQQNLPIDLNREQNRLFSEMRMEAFPEAHFSRILEKGEFRQAAALIRWYLEQAGKYQWDCQFLKMNLFEACLQLLQCQKPDLTVRDMVAWKRRILGISQFKELQDLCHKWTDDLLSGREDGGLEGIFHYIQTNYYEDLTLTGVAKLFNYNYYYLSSAFLRQAGVSFTEYVNQIRIQEACRLLKDSEMPVSMVADMTGYASSGYFSRIFKKYQGIAPSEYRRRVQEQI